MGYSQEDIYAARKYIKQIGMQALFPHGVNMITDDDVQYIFDLYDQIFFHSQIREKIGDMAAELKFYASERTSGVGGLCGIEREKEMCNYYFDIAPNIIHTIFEKNRNGLGWAAGVGCEDKFECLQLIIEHQIIHLLLILWDYYPLEYANNIYASHGLLFQCMAKEYFGHSRFEHDLGASINVEVEGVKDLPETFRQFQTVRRGVIPFGYSYWSNSCYLDSLLIVLLENISPFWRKAIMEADLDKVTYRRNACEKPESKIDTIPKLREYSKSVQRQIKADFKAMPISQNLQCSMLRSLLIDCLPSMKKKNSWVIYSVVNIYDALSSMFPGLVIDVPVQIHRWKSQLNRRIPDPINYQRESTLLMWDYLDPLVGSRGEDVKQIRWDLFESPVIVFYNGGTPRIKTFNQAGREKGVNIIARDNYPFDVTKARAFGETIINGRYELVGVITLLGVPIKGEGGSHYVGHFMGTDGNWYFYDDMISKIVLVEKLPVTGVWKEEKGQMPAMYFYQKVM